MWSNKTIDFSGLEPELKKKFRRFVKSVVYPEDLKKDVFTLDKSSLSDGGAWCELHNGCHLIGETCILNLLFKRICDTLVPGHSMCLKVCKSLYNWPGSSDDQVMYVAFDKPRNLNPEGTESFEGVCGGANLGYETQRV
jgi:hypothetical protein